MFFLPCLSESLLLPPRSALAKDSLLDLAMQQVAHLNCYYHQDPALAKDTQFNLAVLLVRNCYYRQDLHNQSLASHQQDRLQNKVQQPPSEDGKTTFQNMWFDDFVPSKCKLL